MCKIAGSLILVSTNKLMGAHKISYEVDAVPTTYVYIAIDGSYHRCILLSDESKKDSA
jgi:hypothetical protein